MFVSPKHKTIGVPAAPGLVNLFPKGRVVDFQGTPTLLLPHDPHTTFALRKHGLDVPAPVLTQYAFQSGDGKPVFDVQRNTVAMMTTTSRSYVLNGMGTGKTRCALWAYDYLKGNGLAKKMLVIAPLSTLKFTWAAEVLRTLPHLKVGVLHGNRQRRTDTLADRSIDIYVINHDGLKIVMDQLSARPDIDCLCIDELAVYRNGSTDRSKDLREYARRMKWVWGMTGSPTPRQRSCATAGFGQVTWPCAMSRGTSSSATGPRT